MIVNKQFCEAGYGIAYMQAAVARQKAERRAREAAARQQTPIQQSTAKKPPTDLLMRTAGALAAGTHLHLLEITEFYDGIGNLITGDELTSRLSDLGLHLP